ncbi:MAG: hypothetical protein ABI142_08335 [Bryocella sp.]
MVKTNALGEHDPLIRAHPSYVAVGEDAATRHATYRALVTDAIPEQDLHAIRVNLQRQHALGPDAFRASIEALSGRRAGPARTGRPRKNLESQGTAL